MVKVESCVVDHLISAKNPLKNPIDGIYLPIVSREQIFRKTNRLLRAHVTDLDVCYPTDVTGNPVI